MTANDEIKDLRNRVDNLKKEVDGIKDTNRDRDISRVEDYSKLEKLIIKAVQDGNKEVISLVKDVDKKLQDKITTLEKRIEILEKEEGEKAKRTIATIVSTSLSWLMLGLLGNLPTIIKLITK